MCSTRTATGPLKTPVAVGRASKPYALSAQAYRLSSAKPTTPRNLSVFRNTLKVVNGVRKTFGKLFAKRGRRDATRMASGRGPHEPACMVAHNVISKLAAIVGRCDLLNERNQNIESAKHIAAIREIAESTIKELTEHQKTVEAEKRKGG